MHPDNQYRTLIAETIAALTRMADLPDPGWAMMRRYADIADHAREIIKRVEDLEMLNEFASTTTTPA